MTVALTRPTEAAEHPCEQRGLITRPGVAEVGRYREHVEQAQSGLLEAGGAQERAGARWAFFGLRLARDAR